MLTAPSTPSSALTVTGASTVTPTAPSVTDAVSFGTRRAPNGVPLSVLVYGWGGWAGWLSHPLTPKMADGISTSAATRFRIRWEPTTDWTCDMYLLHVDGLTSEERRRYTAHD